MSDSKADAGPLLLGLALALAVSVVGRLSSAPLTRLVLDIVDAQRMSPSSPALLVAWSALSLLIVFAWMSAYWMAFIKWPDWRIRGFVPILCWIFFQGTELDRSMVDIGSWALYGIDIALVLLTTLILVLVFRSQRMTTGPSAGV